MQQLVPKSFSKSGGVIQDSTALAADNANGNHHRSQAHQLRCELCKRKGPSDGWELGMRQMAAIARQPVRKPVIGAI
ncbi:hypothetical protein ACNKHP_19965 [Shigella boydii]